MKTSFKYYLIYIFSVISLASCKSALDKDPLTEYTKENFWTEPAQASAALNGAYLRIQLAFNNEFAYYGDARSDIYRLYLENNAQAIAVIYNRLDPNIPLSDWSNFYRIINQVNSIIKNVQSMNQRGLYATKTSEYNRVLGQALAIRGFIYFYMTKVWGAVPFITEPTFSTGNILDFNTPRTPVEDIYKQVSYDLLVARELLPTSYSSTQQSRAMMTRGAVDAIMTDYYSWRNMPDSVLTTSERVISNNQYALTSLYDRNINYLALAQTEIDKTEYSRMFTEGFSRESILEIAYSNDENTNSGLLTLFGGGTGVAQFYAATSLVTSYQAGDLRPIAFFKNENQIFKNFTKAVFDKTTENDKNVIMYRLADILLLRAEAYNKLNNRAAAWPLIKQVRERAFGPVEIQSTTDPTKPVPGTENPNNNFAAGPTSNSAKAAFLAMTEEQAEDYILDERKRELCFEGKRWFDLVRTGKAIQVMKPINGLSNPENILWPINLNIIRQNPKIEQNNFYK